MSIDEASVPEIIPEEKEEVLIPRYIVCIGNREAVGKKILPFWKYVEPYFEGGKQKYRVLPEREFSYNEPKKTGMNAVPGSIFKIHQTANGNTRVSGKDKPVYEGYFQEDELIEWKAKHDFYNAAQRLERIRKEDSKYDPIREALAPIKEMMEKTDYIGARAIWLAVMEELGK